MAVVLIGPSTYVACTANIKYIQSLDGPRGGNNSTLLLCYWVYNNGSGWNLKIMICINLYVYQMMGFFSVSRKRPCLFCGQYKIDLRAHIISVHKDEKSVQELQTLGCKEQIVALNRRRKQGIAQKNKDRVSESGESANLISERKTDSSRCSGFFSQKKKGYFGRHVNQWNHQRSAPPHIQ